MRDQKLMARICRYADAHGGPEAPFETGIEGFTLVRCRAPDRARGDDLHAARLPGPPGAQGIVLWATRG